MEKGNHLRVGFDPRMGFPPCGFVLYRRGHQTGPTRELEFGRMFEEKINAPFRHGYLQDGVAVFHPDDPRPTQSGKGGVELGKQLLGISFRRSPFLPDSNPQVCEVRLQILAEQGVVTVQAFDDRYDNNGFRKILVAQQEESFDSPTPFDLRADLISLVEIQAPEGAQLISFEYTLISERGWNRMMFLSDEPWGSFKDVPLLLPTPESVSTTASTYPTCRELEFPQEDSVIEKELTLKRLEKGFVAKTDELDVHGEYRDFDQYLAVYLGPGGERFKELRESLKALQSVP